MWRACGKRENSGFIQIARPFAIVYGSQLRASSRYTLRMCREIYNSRVKRALEIELLVREEKEKKDRDGRK
jgi:hypothetical protein